MDFCSEAWRCRLDTCRLPSSSQKFEGKFDYFFALDTHWDLRIHGLMISQQKGFIS